MAPGAKPPSRVDTITFPVFGMAWLGTGAVNLETDEKACSVWALCGGGGSARTGVGNSISVTIICGGALQEKRSVRLDTGNDIPVHVALQRIDDATIYLLAAIGDGVRLYSIPLRVPPSPPPATEQEQEYEFVKPVEYELVASVSCGKGAGSNAVAFSPLGNAVAVGCENGLVKLFSLHRGILTEWATMEGHIKAVCAVTFSPRANHILSSAKDGTARIWDANLEPKSLQASVSNTTPLQALCVLNCPPPEEPKGAPPKRGKKGPQQVLVRGCAYGDLEGKVIYTVSSGRRSVAHLTKWKQLVPLAFKGSSTAAPLQYNGTHKVVCAPCPVSSMSLSGDASFVALGRVDGTISLFGLTKETPELWKQFETIHELPVTCVAARPGPLPLPGEVSEEYCGASIQYDVMSASADNQLAHLTRQRAPRKRRSTQSSSSSSSYSNIQLCFHILLLLLAWFLFLVFQTTKQSTCSFTDIPCIREIVLWAPSTRPGISFPPQ
eukprot:scaffold501574_cov59-Attheya_sp.AAC.1